ncbi:MAG: sigma-54-dependent Fis family transcriptional regulator [Acidobacteria bacterium]|nr:sigma-54-dependent Fis family transcriptional regulator [Acidobacteriota bacterium]
MKRTLSAENRRFFHLLSAAATTNPFSDEYVDLQLQIADCDASVPADGRLERIVARVAQKVRDLEAENRADIHYPMSEDRELLRRAFLFDAYHRFLPLLDRHIGDQSKAGDKPLPVPFYGEVFTQLCGKGFSADEARFYLAVFYQICRAFFFIDRSLVGRCESMKKLRRHLWNNVFTSDIRLYERYFWSRMEDFSTMLLGETGTGKGAAAAAIGRSGFIPFDEKRGAFVESFTGGYQALNLSQFPETLIESELFGHRKGAFTGAVEAHEGIFARSSACGSIFLDEIGDVGEPVQIKLLHVLQDRSFTPLGSHEKRRFRGRIIAATNRSLDGLRASGRFRDDFFYRLCSDVVQVPSLRQRIRENPAEMDELLSLIVFRIAGETSPAILNKIRRGIAESPGADYAWPGNVRELEQAVRRILLTGAYQGDKRVSAPDLQAQLHSGIETGSLDAESLLAGYCELLYRRHGTYEEVARRTRLDRRTAKANIQKYKEKRESL